MLANSTRIQAHENLAIMGAQIASVVGVNTRLVITQTGLDAVQTQNYSELSA